MSWICKVFGHRKGEDLLGFILFIPLFGLPTILTATKTINEAYGIISIFGVLLGMFIVLVGNNDYDDICKRCGEEL